MEPPKETMRLGHFEFLAMNNPLRNWRMRRREFPLLQKMLTQEKVELHHPTIVDMGCGSGYSTYLLQKCFSPGKIHAFDLMPEQIALAKRRGLGIDFQVADATSMPVESSTCDGVFDFGVLHHIPAWRQVLSEAWRVLLRRASSLSRSHTGSLDGANWKKALLTPVSESWIVGSGTEVSSAIFNVERHPHNRDRRNPNSATLVRSSGRPQKLQNVPTALLVILL
jgi:ubiquinone/menaquinone biosynthesis C-methylase UbiE